MAEVEVEVRVVADDQATWRGGDLNRSGGDRINFNLCSVDMNDQEMEVAAIFRLGVQGGTRSTGDVVLNTAVGLMVKDVVMALEGVLHVAFLVKLFHRLVVGDPRASLCICLSGVKRVMMEDDFGLRG